MSDKKTVQLGLGEAVVMALNDFASMDIPPVEELETSLFRGVRDSSLRKKLAETLYGARWLYKLGLVTLATGERRAAHVRAQVIDYAAICEAVLVDAVAHGIAGAHLAGSVWNIRGGHTVTWPTDETKIRRKIRKSRDFYWLIEVAHSEHILTEALAKRLHWLRKRRNRVHIAEMAAINERTYLSTSRDAYQVMHKCVGRVTRWMTLHA